MCVQLHSSQVGRMRREQKVNELNESSRAVEKLTEAQEELHHTSWLNDANGWMDEGRWGWGQRMMMKVQVKVPWENKCKRRKQQKWILHLATGFFRLMAREWETSQVKSKIWMKESLVKGRWDAEGKRKREGDEGRSHSWTFVGGHKVRGTHVSDTHLYKERGREVEKVKGKRGNMSISLWWGTHICIPLQGPMR